MTSVNTGSGVVKVCNSAVAGDDVLAVVPGPCVGVEVVCGVSAAVGSGAGLADADADAVDVGSGDGSARAAESGTVVSEATATTSATKSAVVLRIKFTFFFHETADPPMLGGTAAGDRT
jgi:hypothetical protein